MIFYKFWLKLWFRILFQVCAIWDEKCTFVWRRIKAIAFSLLNHPFPRENKHHYRRIPTPAINTTQHDKILQNIIFRKCPTPEKGISFCVVYRNSLVYLTWALIMIWKLMMYFLIACSWAKYASSNSRIYKHFRRSYQGLVSSPKVFPKL